MKAWALIFLFAATGLVACTVTSEQSKKAPFAITEATVQEQLPGVQGAGISRDYTFKAVINTEASLVFDSVWVDGKKLPVRITKEGKLLQDATALKAGDTIMLVASHYEPGEQEITNTVKQSGAAKWPVLSKSEALIRFYLNSEQAYYPIATLTKLPPVILP